MQSPGPIGFEAPYCAVGPEAPATLLLSFSPSTTPLSTSECYIIAEDVPHFRQGFKPLGRRMV